MKEDAPRFVHASSYPDGWEKRQYDDLARVLDAEPENVDIAMLDGVPVGWVCTRVHPEDQMGETHILAVDPAHRRHDIGRALNEHPYRRLREAGLRMAMVETGSDRGHAPARATYEAEGFVRWRWRATSRTSPRRGRTTPRREDVRGSRRTANIPGPVHTMRSSGYSGFHMRS